MAWFLYLLECSNGAVYTGIAVDVEARFAQHRSGKGAKYTRANPPKKILGIKRFRTRASASREEWRVKQLSAVEKRAFAKALKALKALPLIFLFSSQALASQECVVRVAPGFNPDYARALNSRNFKVVTDPVVQNDDFHGFLERYVKEGEHGILAGGLFRGGFELWVKGAKEPVFARWHWFRGTERVIREELPICADFLATYGRR